MTLHSFISWAAAAALLLTPTAAVAQHHGGAPRAPVTQRDAATHDDAKAIGKRTDVQFSQPTRVAGTMLEPGYYRVQMQTDGDRHELLIARRETTRRGGTTYGVGAGEEVARVRCIVIDGEKNGTTALNLVNEGGVSVLRTIRIKGERGAHVLGAADAR